MNRKIANVFRVLYVVHYVLLGIYCCVKTGPKIVEMNNEKVYATMFCGWAFLSVWNIVFQMAYLLPALVIESSIIVNKKIRRAISQWNCYIFSALVFPFGFLVFTIFWSFFVFKKEFLAPLPILNLLSFEIQIGAHVVIVFPIITEILFAKPAPPNYVSAFKGTTVVLFSYVIILEFVHMVFGVWMYSIFEILHWSDRIVFGAMVYLLNLIFFNIGFACLKYDLVWSVKGKQL